mmetsp:Transcript_12277/g.25154  ORF Transcript_12277/g.25154 Transcript_12277/m.25154 type:complete len:318 (+) Transcript_12277:79-1032(+)
MKPETTLEALAAKTAGPMPTGNKWRGLPVPFFFNEESAKAFGDMPVKADDVVLSSPVKAGTSWLHKILALMLFGLDDEGVMRPPASEVTEALLKGQVYPDALPMTTPDEPSFMGGKLSFPDLCSQQSPRLFTTHFFGEYLPKSLTDPTDGQGRLIVCLRNPKDVLTSLHFFRGEAKDGWLGNEHGPGSVARFCSPECPNAYGSVFQWMKATEACIAPLVTSGRCLCVYYEDMKADLPSELARISKFLDLPLSDAKRDALVAAVSFKAMSTHITARKGEIGDWKNHLDRETWKIVDKTIEEQLGESKLYAGLARFAKY